MMNGNHTIEVGSKMFALAFPSRYHSISSVANRTIANNISKQSQNQSLLSRPRANIAKRQLTTEAQQSSINFEAPPNEVILDYKSNPSSEHRLELEQCLKELSSSVQDVPIVIKGKRYEISGDWQYQRIPFDHRHQLARFKYAQPELIAKAIDVSQETRLEWNSWPLGKRIELFERAANLAASAKYRFRLNAATMLGQGKTIGQAEIDSGAELVDFLRFNAHYARQLLKWSQPVHESPDASIKNSISFRALDGFVASISPFNFTAIGANLASAPTIMGNCVAWKPADSSILANYITMQLFEEAGFPDGVINFVPADGFTFGRQITGHPKLAGINFTGSLATFRWLWNEVGLNVRRFDSFPRLSGECGGKNFHFVHESADVDVVVAQTIRSAFEYSGQKCSACSRLYVPASLWEGPGGLSEKLVDQVQSQLILGPTTDLDKTHLSAVIDQRSFDKCTNFLQFAKSQAHEHKVLCGGQTNDQVGYYVEPTIIECKNPRGRLMQEEIFGPILSVFVYPDGMALKTMDLIDECRYALTGSVFARDETFIELASSRLQMVAGNFYVNDKSTGAVVGQQPFGGARLSGTNDKPGGPHNLMRWCNQRTIKQNFNPSREITLA